MALEDYFSITVFSLFLIVLLGGGFFQSKAKKRKVKKDNSRAAMERFLQSQFLSITPDLTDNEIKESLQPLKEIGQDYPPANTEYSRSFTKIRIARSVLRNFDDLFSSIGHLEVETFDQNTLDQTQKFIDRHLFFVKDTFSNSEVIAIVWEMFLKARESNKVKTASSENSQTETLRVDLVDRETGEITEVEVEMPEVEVNFSSETELSEEDRGDEYLGYIDKTDFWDEGSFDFDIFRRCLDLKLEFDYPNKRGQTKRRTVQANLYGNINSYSVLLRGYCFDRKATRHFKVEKISNCVDLNTNKQIANVRQYLDDIYNASVHRTLDLLQEEHNDLVSGLLYIARVGGALSKRKREAIVQTLMWYCGDDRLKDQDFQHFLANFFETPSITGFQRIIGRINRSDDVRQRTAIIDGAEAILNSIRNPKATEEEAVAYVVKKVDQR